VTLYNDICGEFNDNLLVNIESLPLKKIPVKVKVTGSPIALALNQVGINLRGEFPLINMGTIIKGSGNIEKSFHLVNNGPSEAAISNLNKKIFKFIIWIKTFMMEKICLM